MNFAHQAGANHYRGSVDVVLSPRDQDSPAGGRVYVKVDCPLAVFAACSAAVEALIVEGYQDAPPITDQSVAVVFDYEGLVPPPELVNRLVGRAYKSVLSQRPEEPESD